MVEPIEKLLQDLVREVNARAAGADGAEKLFFDNFAPLVQRLLHLWQGYQRKHGIRG